MPTYDYICDACKYEFEEFQSITAKPLRKCPECGKNKLRRLIGTGAGIIFKGSGFYETDYRSDSYNKAKKADTEPKADKAEKSDKPEKTSDPKPDAKSSKRSASKRSASKPKPDKPSQGKPSGSG